MEKNSRSEMLPGKRDFSNVPRKYAILAGYKIVMNQRSVCTRFINPCHSGFAVVSRDL